MAIMNTIGVAKMRKEEPIKCDNCGKLIYSRDSKEARAYEWRDDVYYLCCDECVVEFARDCSRKIYHWEFLTSE